MHELRRLPNLDLIHLHTGKRLGAIGRYVAARRKLPYVISLHGGVYDVPTTETQTWTAPAKGTFEWGKVLGWWVGARRVLDDAAAIICVGRTEEKEALLCHPNQMVVHLPNGVDAQHFVSGDGSGFRARHEIPQDAFVILLVGRIDPQKNQLLAVRLLSELRREDPRVHLVLIGPVTNTDYNLSLSKEITALSLDRNVTLIRGLEASDPELVNAYHAANLFLLPSVHEPFGIVILEAWAAGLPVVASNVGGVPSFVSDGENGCLFPSGDLGALLNTARTLIACPDCRRKIAAAGKKKAVGEFGWDRITRQLVGIYEEAIRANSLRK
jgi:glycosyltransferase involved in cell wall biosynthesis